VARVRELDLIRVYSCPMPPGWAESALHDLEPLTHFLNNFHEKWHAQDPRRLQMKTIEFGWSGMPGGSSKQMAAQEEGVPFPLNAWEHPCGHAWAEKHLALIMPCMWKACKAAYHAECERMWYEGRSEEYGLYGTAWNKVTIGLNCPTTLHYDDKNLGLTALLIVGLYGLKGGEHALFGIDMQDLVLVKECEAGTLIFGDYKRVLHGNFATIAGLRLVINAYCSKLVVGRFSYHQS
jgi:hypothetical protein